MNAPYKPPIPDISPQRLQIVDQLRGLIIILMVLDHVRAYFHAQAFVFDPTDPAMTTPALFATRWITHLCAPGFVFLSGVSIWLQAVRKTRTRGFTFFLLSRGLWLIALEFTIISFAFNFFVPFLFVQVIWAIGFGMLVLAFLIHIPRVWVAGLGALILLIHAFPPPANPATEGFVHDAWRLLFEPGKLSETRGVVLYPGLAWLGVMCLGYALGPLFQREEKDAIRLLGRVGLAALLAFVVIRSVNLVGDPHAWQHFPTTAQTALSFLRVSKYPPSFDYTLATLGVLFAMAPALAHIPAGASRILLVFGSTPLFTYLIHLYLVHGAAVAVAAILGFPQNILFDFVGDPSRSIAAGWGFGLPIVYGIWAVVCVLLYPISRWFSCLRERRRAWWMSYL